MADPGLITADALQQSGSELLGLGRWLNRSLPPVTCRGSQGAEDEILAQLLPGDGLYVDIGAGHAIDCSNTWSFYQRGWRGLVVEPLAECWYSILRQRPGDFLAPVAVSDASGYARLRICRCLSSLRPDWPIDEQAVAYVETETLAGLLARYPTIRAGCRLCSIDVEGSEPQVLKGNDWTTFHPECLVIEHRQYGTNLDLSGAWKHLLGEQGYRLRATTTYNQIWTNP